MSLEANLDRIDRQLIGVNRPMRKTFEVGPLTAMLDPISDIIYGNYAIPTGEPDAKSLEDLKVAFRAENRRPRVEFIKERFPNLPALLQNAGFTLEVEVPCMLCPRADFMPRWNPEVDVEILGPDGDIDTMRAIGNEAFGMDEVVSEERKARSREAIAKGLWIAALGRIGGEGAGSAILTPFDGVAELAGVATRSHFRRRQVASSVSSTLMERYFQSGDLVWLSAIDDLAKSVYEGLGFRSVATQAHYSVPA